MFGWELFDSCQTLSVTMLNCSFDNLECPEVLIQLFVISIEPPAPALQVHSASMTMHEKL